MFVGGGFPIGYDLEDHKLVVNERDAETVRTLFRLYVELGTVRRVQAEAAKMGLRTKVRKAQKTGRVRGGVPFQRNHLYWILKNRTYLGEIHHKGQIHIGQHRPIVDRALFDRVQKMLARHSIERVNGDHALCPSPLAGILFDDRGNRMTPTHTRKEGVQLRYYMCQALLKNQPEKAGALRRVPAREIEGIVAQQCCELLSKPARLIEQLAGENLSSENKQTIANAAAKLSGQLLSSGDKRQLAFARATISEIVAGPEAIQITFNQGSLITFNQGSLKIALGVAEKSARSIQLTRLSPPKLEGGFAITVPIHLTRSGRNKCMVIADDKGERRLMNDGMVLAVARAIKWDGEVRAGTSPSKIASRENLSKGYVTRVMPLAFLAPDIVKAIYEGRQPLDLKVKALCAKLPLDWTEQRRVHGFPAR
jgi:hypothetical protein